MLLRLHPQGRDAGALAVRLAVQLVAIEARADAGRAEEATHVSLAHVAAGAGDTEEVGDTASRVGMRMGGHAGGHWLTGDDASGHRGGSSVVANPGGILNLWGKTTHQGVGKDNTLDFIGCSENTAHNGSEAQQDLAPAVVAVIQWGSKERYRALT